MIHSFTGDRILYEGPSESPLTLVDVESSGNCGQSTNGFGNVLLTEGRDINRGSN